MRAGGHKEIIRDLQFTVHQCPLSSYEVLLVRGILLDNAKLLAARLYAVLRDSGTNQESFVVVVEFIMLITRFRLTC